jgi:hypothetical protein
MGRPGTGLAGRAVGIPGRGAPGAGAPGTAGGRASRATISARGGTTGRAAGWPTKFGFAGGRQGLPPPVTPLVTPPLSVGPDGGGGAAPGKGRAAGRAGVGIVGTAGPVRRAPGVVTIVGTAGADGGAGEASALAPGVALGASAVGASAAIGGMGWRGPERICPGRGGGGAERDGITGPRLNGAPGCPVGCPVAKGGRNGNAGRTGLGASAVSGWAKAAGLAVSCGTGAGPLCTTAGALSTAGAS